MSTAEARLWKELGGTDAGRQAWSQGRRQSLAIESNAWTVPAASMPPWILVDLSGHTWNLKDLQGKVVVIDVWATWCVPCRQELPEIQKLYTSSTTRRDIQILTFNTDEETGRVLPFIKAAGYTFPVLLAKDYLATANLSD